MNWGTDDIAAYVGLSREYTTDVIVKKAGFPKPVVALSQKNKRWDPEAVKAFVANPTGRRR